MGTIGPEMSKTRQTILNLQIKEIISYAP